MWLCGRVRHGLQPNTINGSLSMTVHVCLCERTDAQVCLELQAMRDPDAPDPVDAPAVAGWAPVTEEEEGEEDKAKSHHNSQI